MTPIQKRMGVGEEVPGAGGQKRGGTTQGSLFPESILNVEAVRRVTVLDFIWEDSMALLRVGPWLGGLKNAYPASSADAQWTPVAIKHRKSRLFAYGLPLPLAI